MQLLLLLHCFYKNIKNKQKKLSKKKNSLSTKFNFPDDEDEKQIIIVKSIGISFLIDE